LNFIFRINKHSEVTLITFPSLKLPNISKRPAHTILFVTEAKVFRVNTDKTGIQLGSTEEIDATCSSPNRLADCINKLSMLSSPLGHKVWILYIGLPISLLSVPTAQVAGVDEATLSQALQFEMEGLTGQSSIDTQLAYTLLKEQDEMSTYWVCQINQLHLEDLYKAVKKAGSSLGGLIHPAAQPLSLENPENQDWMRIECWPDQVVAVSNHPSSGFSVNVFPFDNRHWQIDLEQWCAGQQEATHTETLINNQIELIPSTDFSLHLRDAELAAVWMRGWASLFVKKTPPGVPILRYQSKVNADLVLMGSGAAAALFICLSHFVWHLYYTNDLKAKFTVLQQTETSINSMQRSLSDTLAKRANLRAKIDKVKEDSQVLPQLIKSLQLRPAALLETLSQGRPENLLVETISVDQDEVIITGIALDATSANELSNYLEKQLSVLGWSVIAPAIKNLEIFAAGGPWDFEIRLLDQGIEGLTKSLHNAAIPVN
jgi:Tfp pilus assembly protein PilN